MFEPEELMARIVDLEEQLKVSEMAPPAAEQLIAFLEGEIAKRDEELAACRIAVENCDLFRARIVELQRAEKNDAIAYKAALERQDELRTELSEAKAQGVVMPDVNAAAKALCNRHAMICGVDADDQWKEYSQDFIADAETVLANSRLCAATVLEVNAHCAVIPEPYGWVAAGSFYTDRESAICAAEKTPCIDVYSRPQMNALENRSLQRQELAEELARQLNASCAEIRNMRNLYAAPVSEAKAQGVVMPELRDFEEWWCSTPILRESKRTIAEKAWLAARLNASPVQQVSVPDGKVCVPVEVLRLYEFMAASFTPFTSQHEQIAISLRKAKAAMLAAAPAAPAADAGDVLEQAMYTLISIGYHENSGLVHELRQALAAHRTTWVV